MKSQYLFSLLAAATLAAPLSAETAPASEAQAIHDSIGRAGMAAAALGSRETAHSIIMVGGANFPQAKPNAKSAADRGPKVFYADVALWKIGGPAPEVIGALPYPVGYAASIGATNGMIVAGGCNADGHLAKTTGLRIGPDGKATAGVLPDLPCTTAYPAFASTNEALYVMGGQEKADSTCCLNRVFMLNMHDPAAGWKELAPMPDARMLASAGIAHGRIYVAGGCSLHPNAEGQAERTYLDTVLCYDIATNTWSTLPERMPETIVGAATPMQRHGDKLLLLCGDPGNYYRASLVGKAPAQHPGQSRRIYSFDPATLKWTPAGEAPLGIATAPSVAVGNTVYIISGETGPGVRTPIISEINPQ